MVSFLVTGATGRQGGGLISSLLDKGITLHALTRNSTSDAALQLKNQGVLVFEGDIGDFDAVARAAHGTSGVFLNPPYRGGPTSSTDACRCFVRAIQSVSSVQTLVVSTALGAGEHAARSKQNPTYPQADYYTDKALVETIVRESGVRNVVILRPPWLMHNYLPPFSTILFPGIAASRKLITGLKEDTKVPHLDAGDVGRWAAAALLEPERFSGKELDLASENLTIAEITRALSRVLGYTITAPVADFDKNGEAVGVVTRALPSQLFANSFDTSVDVSKLEQEFQIQNVRLEEYLRDHLKELVATFAI